MNNNDARLCSQDITLVSRIEKNELGARMSLVQKCVDILYRLRGIRQIPIIVRNLFFKLTHVLRFAKNALVQNFVNSY